MFEYDSRGRLVSTTETDSNNLYYENLSIIEYAEDNSILSSTFSISLDSFNSGTSRSFKTSYTYNNGFLSTEKLEYLSDIHIISYEYDGFKRLGQVNRDLGTFDYTTDYTYSSSGVNTSRFVSRYVNTINSNDDIYDYTYDSKGKITKIAKDGNETTYTYDDLGQLIREDNRAKGYSYVYTYDNAGNITTKKTYAFTTGTLGTVQSTQNYTYGDSSWKDLLTQIGSTTISYDSIGNPTTIGAERLTWEGRELTSWHDGDAITIDYGYNADGIRTYKDVYDADLGYSTRYEYTLSGSQIVKETVYVYDSIEIYTLVYIYDENGAPIGYRYRTPSYASGVFDGYFFEKNLQGDIVAVYNQSGTKLINYTYDAWGSTTTAYLNGGGSTAAKFNPFRYRGYYFDSETGSYYLQSRYYNPTWGRFISADNFSVMGATPTSLTDKNLFSYCDNNPINRTDDDGEFWHIIAGAAIGGVIGAVSKIVTNAIDGKEDIWDGVLVAGLTGAASGALAATGVGLVGQIAGGAAIAMAGNATQQGIDILQGDETSFNVGAMLFDGAVGALGGLVGGAGASKGNSKTAIRLGKQLFNRIKNTGEWSKAFVYYGKNMMNGAGKSIYKELGIALAKSGIASASINVSKSIYGRITQ